MGFRNFGSLLLVFLILMLVFGTQRLRGIGNDLAGAIRSFRKGMQEDEKETSTEATVEPHLEVKEAVEPGKSQ